MSRKPLCHVDPTMFLVLTGPVGSTEAKTELERLRTACRNPDGQQMWAPEPVFTSFHGTPEEVAEHVREVVVPALSAATPVVLEGGWWPAHTGTTLAEAAAAGAVAWAAQCPTLTIVFPHQDATLSDLTGWAGPAAFALRPGHTADLSLQVFSALSMRGFYSANGWLAPNPAYQARQRRSR